MASTQRNSSDRLRKLYAEQQSALQPGVHYHPLPPSQLGAAQHGMTGAESPLNSRLLRRPMTADTQGSSSYRTHTLSNSAASSPRSAMSELRAKGMQEEALRAAAEGRAASKDMASAAAASPQVRDAADISKAGSLMNNMTPPVSRPGTAGTPGSSAVARGRQPIDPMMIPTSSQQRPRPPLQREDLPAPQNLPSATAHASNPPRRADEAMDDAKCANPFFVAHQPPVVDMQTGEPIDSEQQQPTGMNIVDNLIAAGSAAPSPSGGPSGDKTPSAIRSGSSRPSSSSYRTSTALTQSPAAEYHESQREVLNLQLRGVAEHALKLRRTVADAPAESVQTAARETADLCNGCTAALRAYEDNYDCVYDVKVPELPKLAEECKLKTSWSELQRLLELPALDPDNVRAALREISQPVLENPTEDSLRVLSQSRLDLTKRVLGKLDGAAGLSVADCCLRMYELLHTDVLSAPRELLAADEASLGLMQRDVENLYVKRTNLLDEVRSNTNRTLPLMADGPLSAAGGVSSAVTPSGSAASPTAGGASASREMSRLLASDDEEVRAEVSRQLMTATSPAGRAVRVHTVEALSPPRDAAAAASPSRTLAHGDVAVPDDTEEDTDGRKLSVAEATQRREVNVAREVLQRRTHRCNAMLDFVEGVRAYVAEALEQQQLAKDITGRNRMFAERTVSNTASDLERVASISTSVKTEDQELQNKFSEEQREAHSKLGALQVEETALWRQINELVEKAVNVGKERDDLFMERMRENELEARRQKVVRLRLEKLHQLSTQLTRAKRSMAKYEEAARDAEAFHSTFVAEALGPKLAQEDELITMRGAEALSFATSFRTFVFSAEDLVARLEVRVKALRQRQRSAAMDESVVAESLDVAGRDAYLTEMRRLATMIAETEQRRDEVEGWVKEARDGARTFLPIALAAREAARHNKRPGSSAAAQRAAALAEQMQEDSTFEAAEDAKDRALKEIERAENAFGKQRQTAEEQVEELRSDIRKQRKDAQAQMRSQVQAAASPYNN